MSLAITSLSLVTASQMDACHTICSISIVCGAKKQAGLVSSIVTMVVMIPHPPQGMDPGRCMYHRGIVVTINPKKLPC